VAQLGARLDGIEEVVGSNPIGSTKLSIHAFLRLDPTKSNHRPALDWPDSRSWKMCKTKDLC
jgi:hypothetical protein